MSVQTQLPDPNQAIGKPSTVALLATAVVQWLKLAQQQVNRLSNGSINSCSNAASAPPSAGSITIYAQGDYIRNSAPTVQGSAGSQYVVKGWICVTGGKPGTWVQDRCLTGT